MKKILSILLVFILVVSLVACGEDYDEEGNNAVDSDYNQQQTEENLFVGNYMVGEWYIVYENGERSTGYGDPLVFDDNGYCYEQSLGDQGFGYNYTVEDKILTISIETEEDEFTELKGTVYENNNHLYFDLNYEDEGTITFEKWDGDGMIDVSIDDLIGEWVGYSVWPPNEPGDERKVVFYDNGMVLVSPLLYDNEGVFTEQYSYILYDDGRLSISPDGASYYGTAISELIFNRPNTFRLNQFIEDFQFNEAKNAMNDDYSHYTELTDINVTGNELLTSFTVPGGMKFIGIKIEDESQLTFSDEMLD